MKRDLAVLKAFGDETRLRILFLLAERELCVCEIVAVLGMPQGKISRHLAILKQAGLVSDRRDGTWIYYALRPASTGLTRRLFSYLRKERASLPLVADDLARLDSLVCAGRICVPNPSFAVALGRN